MQTQPLASKLGEITYRSQIVKQHLGQKTIFPSEPSKKEFVKLLKPKLKTTESLFKKLKKKGIRLSPYLEIGSEHCLRPALLESKFDAIGIACDISFYSLANARKYLKLFALEKIPKRICADAYNLPFRSNSFPFIFIYETLHHFPHPKPILDEIYRVLSPGGTLLIGAEPIKQSLIIPIWRRPNKLRAWEKILKFILILPFISDIGKTETEHNIIETSFPLSVWYNSIAIFDGGEITISAYPLGPSNSFIWKKGEKWPNASPLLKVALLTGGSIEALCFKKGILNTQNSINFDNLLICPSCHSKDKIEYLLNKISDSYTCQKCKAVFTKKKGVFTLLEKKLETQIFRSL